QRRSAELPAQSVNWGPWAERGMAAGLSQRDRERMAATGFDMIRTAEALAALDRIVDLNLPQAAVIKARWDAVCARFTNGDLPPLLREVGAVRGAQASSQGSAKAVNALKP